MIEIHEGEYVYLKSEHLEDHVGEFYAEKYRKLGTQCKVVSWRLCGTVGCEDPMLVKVKMTGDDMYWEVPSRMLCKMPQIKLHIPFSDLSSCYVDADGDTPISSKISYSKISSCCTDASISSRIISNMINKLPTMNPRYFPKKIIYNNPATIVFWKDGTKTVVKKAPNEKFNTYHAFCAALAKKIFGNNSRVNAVVKSGEYQTASKNTNFVRDEKGRWVSKSLLKKKK